jgi:hypothetical protein
MGATVGSGRSSRSGSPDPDVSREPSRALAADGEGAPVSAHRRKMVLLACVCILGNEFCERLAYYALQTNLVEFVTID